MMKSSIFRLSVLFLWVSVFSMPCLGSNIRAAMADDIHASTQLVHREREMQLGGFPMTSRDRVLRQLDHARTEVSRYQRTLSPGQSSEYRASCQKHDPVTIDSLFTEVKKLTAPDGAAGDAFGQSLAVSGDTAIIGTQRKDSYTGAAYVFERDRGGPNNWGLVTKITASDGDSNDYFGCDVAISGDTAVIGARADSDLGLGFGSASVFARNQGGVDNWGQVKKIFASDGAQTDNFGYSVAVSGDTIVVGTPFAGTQSRGAAYVFYRNQGGSNNWGQVRKLSPLDAELITYFGHDVAIDGDTIVVATNYGAYGYIGAAYVFYRNQDGPDNWGQVQKITASDGAEGDEFGCSVGISGDTVVVGAEDHDVGSRTDAGSAYVFYRNQGGPHMWGQLKKIAASDAWFSDHFGSAVSISGDTVVVGAHMDDDKGYSSGSVYVFRRNEGGADNWGETVKTTASDGAEGDYFGEPVSISGGTILVGADMDDDKGDMSGSAYIFQTDFSGARASPWILFLLLGE